MHPLSKKTKKRLPLAGLMLAALLQACGGGGGSGDGSLGEEDTSGSAGGVAGMGAPGSSVAGTSGEETAPIVQVGYQPVEGTPVERAVAHAGHGPMAVARASLAQKPTRPEPRYVREWVVSPNGNDGAAGDGAAPFRTINKAISVAGPGELIRVQSGTYEEAVVIGSSAKAGKEGAPITLQGEGSPKIVPAGGSVMVDIARPYWIVDGFDIDGRNQRIFPVAFSGNVRGSILANSEVHDATSGAGVNVHTNAVGATIENNHIHDLSQGEIDTHGVVVQTTTKDTTVRNNDIHHTSGDSVQCLGPEGYNNNAPADGLLVENNHLFSNRENAVDIKTCKNVIIRNNRMHNFRPSSSSKGDAVVVHMSASNVLVESNEIFDSGKGIAVGGNREGPPPSGVILRHNRIFDLTDGSGGEGVGIRLENSSGTQVLNNTITRVPGFALVVGHGTGGPTQSPRIQNNILDASRAVDVGPERPGLKMDNNLFAPAAQVQVGGKQQPLQAWQEQGFDRQSIQATPEFKAVEAEPLAPGQPAVDSGADVGLPYCGAAPDLGAVETNC